MFKKIVVGILGLQLIVGSGYAFAQGTKKVTPFDESVWRVEQLQGQKKTLQSYQDERNFPKFSFNPYTHKVVGNGLCNKFIGKYNFKSDQISVNNLVTTQETCTAKEVNEQDGLFFSYLKQIHSYAIHGKILRLTDAQGHPLIIARRVK